MRSAFKAFQVRTRIVSLMPDGIMGKQWEKEGFEVKMNTTVAMTTTVIEYIKKGLHQN